MLSSLLVTAVHLLASWYAALLANAVTDIGQCQSTCAVIVDRGKWWPVNIKTPKNQTEIYVGRPFLHIFYAHRLCINYVIAMLVLVVAWANITTSCAGLTPPREKTKTWKKYFIRFPNYFLCYLWCNPEKLSTKLFIFQHVFIQGS